MKRCLRVLLVEDDSVLGPLTIYALDALGHESVLATSTEAAYSCLARSEQSFEVVLLDLQLDSRRSEPVIEALRERGFVVPPIIIVSAQSDDELRRAMRLTQAKAFIQKPASLQQIEHAIAEAVA